MSKYFLIETEGPFTVTKERTTDRAEARRCVRSALRRVSERLDIEIPWETGHAPTNWAASRAEPTLVLTLGNYTVTARRVDA